MAENRAWKFSSTSWTFKTAIGNGFRCWLSAPIIFSKGKLYKLGQNVLKENNILVISFNKYGLIDQKIFLDKKNLNEIKFSNKITESEMQKKSFAERFLTSIKEKMYGGK